MLFVSARPKLGERQVKLTHVTDWIEKKLKQEFKVSIFKRKFVNRCYMKITKLEKKQESRWSSATNSYKSGQTHRAEYRPNGCMDYCFHPYVVW